MTFSCFTQNLKENMGGLLGGKAMLPPSQIIGGPATP